LSLSTWCSDYAVSIRLVASLARAVRVVWVGFALDFEAATSFASSWSLWVVGAAIICAVVSIMIVIVIRHISGRLRGVSVNVLMRGSIVDWRIVLMLRSR
jgi:hypothetical protein